MGKVFWLFTIFREGERRMSDNDKYIVPKSEHIDDLMGVELPDAWGSSDKVKKAITKSITRQRVKHGLYASIPMVCRGEGCAYSDTCPLYAVDEHPEGERCPIEISHILTKFQAYTKELDVDQENIIDMTLVKDLIDLDVQLARADNKLAIDGDFIQMITTHVTEEGDEIQNPAIHKAVEYKEKLLKKRHDVLQLLHSTRKDKAGDKLTIQLDPSTYASQLMAQAAAMQGATIIDVTPEDGDE
jgi:hypothetical protein